MRSSKLLLAALLVSLGVSSGAWSLTQERIVRVEPAELTLEIGASVQLHAQVLNAAGDAITDAPVIFYSLDRSAVSVTPAGLLTAHAAGDYQVAALSPESMVPDEPADRTGRFDQGSRAFVDVHVPAPALVAVEFVDAPQRMRVGESWTVAAIVTDGAGHRRPEDGVELSLDGSGVLADVGANTVQASMPGRATIRASVGAVSTTAALGVIANDVVAIDLAEGPSEVRTGDVVEFRASALDAAGESTDARVRFALESWPDPARPESVGAGAAAHVDLAGRFVAEQPGLYAVVASVGATQTRGWIRVVPREIARPVELLGHAPIRDRVTADLWVWEGIDGRDYAVVGTWNAEGHAYFYDVTDPRDMRLVSKVQVDARTVNDVKVSEDGRIAVISREGASNRRNGFVVLDVSNPREVEILSQFDDQLTGGVHNVFVDNDHVYAVNNGRRFDIINIEDPRQPFRVARFETDSPGRSVHDVWVRDGVAYQAGRTDGLIVVDVGGGGRGGSPANPVEMARIPQLTGWNHSAWPFTSPSTGKTYVIGGDEAFYRHPMAPESGGINWREKLPSRATGWLHFVDISDPEHAVEVARYQVPESGPHNYWVDDAAELLYIGHFDAGLRVVDISGDLQGDLYRQGREVARFYTDDAEGFIPNAPFVWGPQLHKGTIFLADFSSGLWAVRLGESASDAAGPAATASAFVDATSDDAQGLRVTVEPAAIDLVAGQSGQLAATVTDAAGQIVDRPVLFFSRTPQSVSVSPSGAITAHRAGAFEIVALVPSEEPDPATAQLGDPGTRQTVPVQVLPAASTELRLEVKGPIAVGSAVAVSAQVVTADGEMRDVRPELSFEDTGPARLLAHGAIFSGSSNAHAFYRRDRPDVVPSEAAGLIEGLQPGSTTLVARHGGLETRVRIDVAAADVGELRVEFGDGVGEPPVRTGDVVRVEVRDSHGGLVDAARYALRTMPDANRAGSRAAGAAAQILPDGRFVAEQPGVYTIVAALGTRRAERTIRVVERNVERAIEFVGQGPVRDRVTSDLWVWEGLDGRDYAITGTWQAEGHAYFWDVTDPTAMERIAEVQVDARTVNDVKVSADGRIAVISREGASNRRNGLVVLDVSNPRAPVVLSSYDDQLTGGVHNVSIHDDHVYAINNGRRWDIINIEDPRNPFRVGRFESSIPGRSVHDVWVHDGIAYQAGNTEGIVLVDVGGGDAGGTPANPVEIGRLPQLTGWNHAVWPFYSKSAGKFYVIAGDESHPVNPRDPGNIISVDARMTSRAMGWLHVLEFSDREHPVEVARYRVPEAGPHNLWIDWDAEVMYVAYFNGGLRVVDVSGELVGDLYRQGREIAKFYSDDLEGYVPNSPFVWGPQPYKGLIFFSDFHSGLWAVRLGDPVEPRP